MAPPRLAANGDLSDDKASAAEAKALLYGVIKRVHVSLLHEIQVAVLQDGSDLGPVLLKLRLLAARIGSQPLAEWVRHESEGYPLDAELPDYRCIPVAYTATFSGPFNTGIKNAPIPPSLVKKFAGEHRIRHRMRESIAAVDDLLTTTKDGGDLGLDAADLILLLQGNVYPEYTCNAVNARISRSSLASIRHAVRSRVLELTLEFEKAIPESASIAIGPAAAPSAPSSVAATQIAQQIIYGSFTSIAAPGGSPTLQVTVAIGDVSGLAQSLASVMSRKDAEELAGLAASEKPDSALEPMGPRVRDWLKKAATGTWKMGTGVVTEVVKEALLKYYGLK